MCSHLHVFTSSSHLLIFLSSYLQIFRSSHLHIFSLSLSPSLSPSLSLCLLPSVTVPLLLFLVSLKSAGSANQAKRSGHFRSSVGTKRIFFFSTFLGPAATFSHETRFECQKTAVKLRFWSVETRFECQKLRSNCDFGWSGRSPFARNVVRASKTNAFLPFWSVGGNPCQKLLFFFATLAGPAATLSHVMKFECQKLRYNWRQPCRTKRGSRQKLQVFCEFGWSGGYPFARNEVRVSKTEGFWWV